MPPATRPCLEAWILDHILLQPLMHKASMSRRATGLALMSRDFSAVRAVRTTGLRASRVKREPAQGAAYLCCPRPNTSAPKVSCSSAVRGGASLEDSVPVVLDARDGPADRGTSFEGLFRAGDIGEFTVCIVVENKEEKERLVVVPGEVQHGDVSVGIAGCEDRPAPGSAPDANWLLGPVIEVVGFRLVYDGAT